MRLDIWGWVMFLHLFQIVVSLLMAAHLMRARQAINLREERGIDGVEGKHGRGGRILSVGPCTTAKG
jgi:hypothetical protein